jgi:hypothetical protein
MDRPLQFRTKTGTCTVTPTQIVLARTGLRGRLAGVVAGGWLYGLCGFGLLLSGGSQLWTGATAPGVIDLAFGGGLVFVFVRARRYSTSPVIERSSIRSVVLHPPAAGLTRGYFTVRFDAGGGRELERLILLPGSMSGGDEEYERAVTVMREAGVL